MFKTLIVKCLSDNYAYVCYNENNEAFVVDPSEAGPVIDCLEKNNLKLKYILNTHHHFDHVGGNYELKERYKCNIVGSEKDKDRIPGIDIFLKEGDKWQFGDIESEIFEISGHTVGHIAFYFHREKSVFTGDTLFSLGCGRLFEGTPKMMWESLKKIRDLPDETNIYCGHEYTLSNAKFIYSIIPSEELKSKINELENLYSKNLASIPSTIQEEKKLNIFLQADNSQISETLGIVDETPENVFSHIRNLKDNF